MAAAVVLTHGPLHQVWCGDCNQSTRYEADVYALSSFGVTRVGRFVHCPRCHDQDPDRPKGSDDA